jgi:hypothetical protein
VMVEFIICSISLLFDSCFSIIICQLLAQDQMDGIHENGWKSSH